jgi:uncharacterized protein
MSLEYPDFIDPQKAAEGHRNFSGTIALSRMERLKPFLANDNGLVSFSTQFDRDALVGVSIKVEVDTALWLLCQRSLEPYQEVIRRTSLLGVIDDISKESLLPEGYEAILAEHGKVSFLTMIEDELILALPQVPRNPDLPELEAESGKDPLADTVSVVESEQQLSQQPRQQPFAGLADQLKAFTGSGKKPGTAGKK